MIRFKEVLRKPKPGRPLDKERNQTLTAQKPWEAEGVSRRTWYRRQKAKAGASE